jgi:hypothetical protein
MRKEKMIGNAAEERIRREGGLNGRRKRPSWMRKI